MGVGFFFKQKTAYELHISDWSSDVCSSDLRPWPSPRQRDRRRYRQRRDDLEIRVSPVEGASAGGAGVVYERQARRESEIGRASCRERVCQYVSISVVAASLTKKQTDQKLILKQYSRRSQRQNNNNIT